MRKLTMLCCVLLLAFSCAQKLRAQEASKSAEAAKAPEPPVHYYHLEFVVQELGADGKAVNSRSYTMTTNTDRANRGVSIRTGSRVPVASGTVNNGVPTTYQYIDVGINFDVHNTREVEGKLSIELSADVSSLATPTGISQVGTPVIRNNRWQAPVLVPLRKATVVFTSDSLDTKGSMQVTLTATPLQ